MLRWPVFILIALLAGCASDPVYDDGPYGYEGGYGGVYDGGYYDSPREFDYDVEQRAVYSRTHYYPSAYPYYHGGYGRHRHYYHRPDRDHGHHDRDHRGGDRDRGGDHGRDRSRGDRSPTPPPRETADRPRERYVPNRPSEAALKLRDRPTRSSTPSRGTPHGNPRGGRSR